MRRVLASKQAGGDTAEGEAQLDRLVCELYGLTKGEREAVGLAEGK